MNPSANGWIKKLLKELSANTSFCQLKLDDFYVALKQSGFIYGSNISIVDNCIENREFLHEELTKVNLLASFYYIHNKEGGKADFVESVINFYNTIDVYKSSFFEELLGEKKSSELLEAMVNKRVHIDDNILTKNFNYFITNALLFVDVIAYQKYLRTDVVSETYLKNLEAAIETIIIDVFENKSEKTKYDKSLIKLIEASLRYQDNRTHSYNEVITFINGRLSKYYITDIVCMAFWSDKTIDLEEKQFLKKLGKDLDVKQDIIEASIEHINVFYETNKDKIALLNSKNMVQSFYDNSSKMVRKLIKRNSKRLLKELKESKELMILLTKSTTRPLSDDEQKKVQDQLLDIFKSIPSLAIFMLPGGMLLLPIFIKFIPKLLPSAFDDNRIEED
ncbi:LETM1-related biofilm-associated protein [Gaetbulibacter jejuensis]|uniref:Letm1 RBD domain-containing protein n=1 Tax=Gaetbulibacter jejuensis TaxID=584607 RepID=A0ABP3V6X9_9FLAO